MSQPWGFNHRYERGLRGWLSRRWVNHRRRVVREQLRKLRDAKKRPPPSI